jgi:hypothetical protein
MVDGYMDGREAGGIDFPERLANRGKAYRHGWLSAISDRNGGNHPAGGYDYDAVRAKADKAMEEDRMP